MSYTQTVPQTGELYDDWNDNELIARDLTVDLKSSLNRQYKMIRPVWGIESGSPVAQNNRLELPAGDTTQQRVTKHIPHYEGFWKFKGSFNTSPTTSQFVMLISDEDFPNNGIYLRLLYSGGFDLAKIDGGSPTNLISGSVADETVDHTYKVIRRILTDNSIEYELFLDGASQGTATDSFMVDKTKLRFSLLNKADAQFNVEELWIY